MTTQTPDFKKLCLKFEDDIKELVLGHDMTPALYEALFDFYADAGKIPYEVAKAVDEDPVEWVTYQFRADYGVDLFNGWSSK